MGLKIFTSKWLLLFFILLFMPWTMGFLEGGPSCGSAITESNDTSTDTDDADTYTVGGSVSGLSGTLVLQNNSADNLSLSSTTSFTFSTAIADGSSYNVTVLTQASGQTCTVSNGSGNIAAANVTNVTVTCSDNVMTLFRSSSTTLGTLGGRSGADSICNSSVGSLTCSNVRAFISVSASDEIQDMPGNYGVPTDATIKSSNGTTLASNWSSLLSGSITNSLADAAVLSSGDFWWSGSTSAGAVDTSSNCSGWSSSSTGTGRLGFSSTTGSGWIQYSGSGVCNETNDPILCLCY